MNSNNVLNLPTILTSPPVSKPPKAKVSRKRSALTIHSANKKPRKSRRVHDLKPEFLSQYYHMPQRKAAELIKVAVITVKRNCKRYGIRWPYRANKYKAANKHKAANKYKVANKYKAAKKPVLTERGRAFHELPLDCMKAEAEIEAQTKPLDEGASECDTDTESIEDDEQVKNDFCQILFSLHKAPIHSEMLWGSKIQV